MGMHTSRKLTSDQLEASILQSLSHHDRRNRTQFPFQVPPPWRQTERRFGVVSIETNIRRYVRKKTFPQRPSGNRIPGTYKNKKKKHFRIDGEK